MIRKALYVLSLPALFFCLSAEGCGTQYTEDSSFRVWRSDTELAAWRTDQGRIRKAPTWSSADPGVELLDVPTVLSQPIERAGDGRRAMVTITGDVEASADLRIRIDGTDAVRVPELHWDTHLDYIVIPADTYDPDAGWAAPPKRPTIQIVKSGPGRVVLGIVDLHSD